jgi:hypothetical protein
MTSPIRKIAGTALVVVAAGSLAFNLFLWSYYSQTRPRQPIQITGQIIPLNNHGSVVFLNKEEDWLMAVTWYGSGALLILGGLAFGNLKGRAKAWKAYRASEESKKPKTLAERSRSAWRLDL